MNPKRGTHIIISLEEDKAHVLKVESEYRFAFRLQNAARVMVHNAHNTVAAPLSHEHSAYVISSIILAYSYLEAALNEFIHLMALSDENVAEDRKLVISTIASENLRPNSRSTTLDQFNLMLRILEKDELAKSTEPYQSADLVRQLRNTLVHPIPGRVVTFDAQENEALGTQQALVRKLRGPLQLPKNATFPADILTYRCARWAVNSTENFFAEFADRSGVDPGFATK